MAIVAQRAVEARHRRAGPRRCGRRRPRARSRRSRDTLTARSSPARRATCVSGAAASSVRNVSTIASSQPSPSARACRSAGTPVVERRRERRCRTRARRRRDRRPAASRHAASASARARRPAPTPAEPAGIGEPNRGVDLAGVVDRRRVEHCGKRSCAGRPGLKTRPARTRRAWRAAPAAARCRDWCSTASSARSLRRRHAPARRAARSATRGERRADRRGAGEEVLVADVGEAAARRHVARLGRAGFEQAGELRRGGDVARSSRPTGAAVGSCRMCGATRPARARDAGHERDPRSPRPRRRRWRAAAPPSRECR